MKKNIFVLFFVFLIATIPSFSFETVDSNPKKELKTFIKQHNKAIANHNIDSLDKFYEDGYRNVDGFDINEISKMMENVSSSVDNIKTTIKPRILEVTSKNAIVAMEEKNKARIKPKDKTDRVGYLNGFSNYILYLKNDKEQWRIYKDEIINEQTIVKYGDAKKIDIELNTPLFINKGENYDLSLKIGNLDEETFALASISKEEIVFPVKEYQEKFRKISKDGILERLVKANDNNKSEYALASVGLVKIDVNKKKKSARIKITGTAYLIKRVNVAKNEKLNKLVEAK